MKTNVTINKAGAEKSKFVDLNVGSYFKWSGHENDLCLKTSVTSYFNLNYNTHESFDPFANAVNTVRLVPNVTINIF